MKNLINQIVKDSKKQSKEFVIELNKETEIKTILDKWFYRNLIPTSSKHKKWESVKQLKEYLIKRKEKKQTKDLEDKLQHIETVNNSSEFKSITITVEWKKSQMWGHNPIAKAQLCFTDNSCKYFQSGSIGGCGYDKGSTAVARALNQCNGLLKLMWLLKDKNIKQDNRELLGYGSGYGLLPSIEGGVGVSCYPKIMKSLGYNFETVASGNSFDVYKIEKIVS